MAAKKSNRRFEVKANLSSFQLAKAKSALTLQIFVRDEKVGELQVGRGSLYWWGKYKQTPKRVNWTKFTEMMNKLAYGES